MKVFDAQGRLQTINGVETDPVFEAWLATPPNIAEFIAGNWKMFYTNGSGAITELALGAEGEVLTCHGVSAAPTMAAVGGSGNWETIYDNTWTVAATSVTISPLDGNADAIYRITVIGIAGHASGTLDFAMRPNNDSGSNYAIGWMQGNLAGASMSVGRASSTFLLCGQGLDPSPDQGFSVTLLDAKSGYRRKSFSTGADRISASVIDFIGFVAGQWLNTADNITSLVILATQTNGIGIGTRIIIEKMVL